MVFYVFGTMILECLNEFTGSARNKTWNRNLKWAFVLLVMPFLVLKYDLSRQCMSQAACVCRINWYFNDMHELFNEVQDTKISDWAKEAMDLEPRYLSSGNIGMEKRFYKNSPIAKFFLLLLDLRHLIFSLCKTRSQ